MNFKDLLELNISYTFLMIIKLKKHVAIENNTLKKYQKKKIRSSSSDKLLFPISVSILNSYGRAV